MKTGKDYYDMTLEELKSELAYWSDLAETSSGWPNTYFAIPVPYTNVLARQCANVCRVAKIKFNVKLINKHPIRS